MDYGLTNKVVLVTAASKGLGKAVATLFAREKATVYICSRDQVAIDRAAQEIGVTGIACDLTSVEDIDKLLNKIPPVDILVTNAGGPITGNFLNISDTTWQDTFELTFMSAVRLIRNVLPHMQKEQWGRIICMTSTSVKQPIPNLITSNALRAAVTNMAKTLSTEVARDGITVNCVAPGTIFTDRIEQLISSRTQASGNDFTTEQHAMEQAIPMERFGTPEEFAAAVVFLASQQASYITGIQLSVDGGVTHSI